MDADHAQWLSQLYFPTHFKGQTIGLIAIEQPLVRAGQVVPCECHNGAVSLSYQKFMLTETLHSLVTSSCL